VICSDTLIQALQNAELHHWRPVLVERVVCDSRTVRPGDVFVAYRGVSTDGHRYVPQAMAAGATAFVVERMLPELAGLPTAVVPNGREAYAHLQAALHGHPGRRLRVIGVTGTDGKTTTVRLISAVLQAAGRRVGSVDSVGARIGDRDVDTGFHTTTPDADDLQSYLADMVAAGTEYAVLEATSEGLAQHRTTGCEFDVAVVTNITHEHLYFHGTYEAYREAKALLFRSLATSTRKENAPKVAVLNADDSSYEYLRAIPADAHLSYGLSTEAADIWASRIETTPSGVRFRLHLPSGEVDVESPLVGRFNVYNILAAAGVAHSQQIPPEAIQEGVATVRGVCGRWERIDCGQPFQAIVDFAHTPNALSVALEAARRFTRGRVIAVYGCAGLRDRAKRPMMGEISGRLADITIITAEDPRTESLEDIMEQIAEGWRRTGAREGIGFFRIGDRREAIATALGMAQPGDTVIVCGKGHERSMCFGTTEHPWSDQEAVKSALRELGYAQ